MEITGEICENFTLVKKALLYDIIVPCDMNYCCTCLHRAEDNYEKVKAQYGASSCYLLKVNSAGGGGGSTAPGTDLWADYLGPREQGEVHVGTHSLLILACVFLWSVQLYMCRRACPIVHEYGGLCEAQTCSPLTSMFSSTFVHRSC